MSIMIKSFKTNFCREQGLGQLSLLAVMETPWKDEFGVEYRTAKAAIECNRLFFTDIDGVVNFENTRDARIHASRLSFQNAEDGTRSNLMAQVRGFLKDNPTPASCCFEQDNILRRVLDHKFDPVLNPKAFNELVSIIPQEVDGKPVDIVFENNWDDTFWGKVQQPDGTFKGTNYLGQLYTTIRLQAKRRLEGCTITPEQVRNWVIAKRKKEEIIGMPEDYPITWALSDTGLSTLRYDSVEEGLAAMYRSAGRTYTPKSQPVSEEPYVKPKSYVEVAKEAREEFRQQQQRELNKEDNQLRKELDDAKSNIVQLSKALSSLKDDISFLVSKMKSQETPQTSTEQPAPVIEDQDVVLETVAQTVETTVIAPIQSPLEATSTFNAAKFIKAKKSQQVDSQTSKDNDPNKQA